MGKDYVLNVYPRCSPCGGMYRDGRLQILAQTCYALGVWDGIAEVFSTFKALLTNILNP